MQVMGSSIQLHFVTAVVAALSMLVIGLAYIHVKEAQIIRRDGKTLSINGSV
jgi:hypothetical protein